MVIRTLLLTLPNEEKLRIVQLVTLAKSAFISQTPNSFIDDVAFVGGYSGTYPWEPARLVDLDVCLFVGKKSPATGTWLASFCADLGRRVAQLDADFECRLIVGPYKPPLLSITRPFIFVHLAVFLEAEYSAIPAVLRWAWRKYTCHVKPNRLRAFAPTRPTCDDVGARVIKLLRRIESGETSMREWLLPDFSHSTVHVTAADVNFAEVCFSSVATCTRHHARALGFAEADTLANREFFDWYVDNLGSSEVLLELAALKERSRNEGFGPFQHESRKLAIAYLRDLAARLQPQSLLQDDRSW